MKKIFLFIIVFSSIAFSQNYIIRQDSLRASEAAQKVITKQLINDTLQTAVRGVYQPLIPNLSDTSKYLETESDPIWTADSSSFYRKSTMDILLNAKQATISNIADTAKYLEKSDSTIYASIQANNLKLNKSGGTMTGALEVPSITSATQTVATDIDFSTSMTFTKTLSGNVNITLSNVPDGQSVTVRFINSGSYTVTWTTTVYWPGGTAPVITTSGTDLVTLIKIGTDIYGAYVQDLR